MFLWLLVGAQFALAALLVLTTSWIPIPWVAILVAAPGILLAVSASSKIGLRRVRIHPAATESTQLVTSGPYGVVRHPMYTGLLWFTAALLLSGFAWCRLLSWLGLLLVLRIKAGHEEHFLEDCFPRYIDYRKNVGQLVPKLHRLFRSQATK
ncbi:hypothetical protein FF011L_33390 [Roseimaritima multifibrata]|uniref:Isoprenylcysteine carboxyl methyltransferase (ICMT) family protein n=1 Tax=Roseimaritima multifibrata TaxID=1930274 RepID=A0A517MI70_9BACT|nr:isoprenylcysteine carboxylmethyltransferase family protein [Roseimaritima multifibrata]QDS94560.1 hypothetical protein FF011L_33390 [Roseimaritima multifibrata]